MSNYQRDITHKKHRDIRKEYERLYGIKAFGVRKYTREYCLAKVADKFYIAAATVENIVYQAPPEDPGQTSIFDNDQQQQKIN